MTGRKKSISIITRMTADPPCHLVRPRPVRFPPLIGTVAGQRRENLIGTGRTVDREHRLGKGVMIIVVGQGVQFQCLDTLNSSLPDDAPHLLRLPGQFGLDLSLQLVLRLQRLARHLHLFGNQGPADERHLRHLLSGNVWFQLRRRCRLRPPCCNLLFDAFPHHHHLQNALLQEREVRGKVGKEKVRRTTNLWSTPRLRRRTSEDGRKRGKPRQLISRRGKNLLPGG